MRNSPSHQKINDCGSKIGSQNGKTGCPGAWNGLKPVLILGVEFGPRPKSKKKCKKCQADRGAGLKPVLLLGVEFGPKSKKINAKTGKGAQSVFRRAGAGSRQFRPWPIAPGSNHKQRCFDLTIIPNYTSWCQKQNGWWLELVLGPLPF